MVAFTATILSIAALAGLVYNLFGSLMINMLPTPEVMKIMGTWIVLMFALYTSSIGTIVAWRKSKPQIFQTKLYILGAACIIALVFHLCTFFPPKQLHTDWVILVRTMTAALLPLVVTIPFFQLKTNAI
ncbi:hypothetical protein LX64_03572 [Chitinophaga skermanii]|uniref:Uncharacterized protein n=2 Tax=Chitinophaga skermanii TaxID=331697 RepID=A0A327QFZ2_9BACT|nr:hypothetical protein LX64_03572 [Chitinophaga skermanii]